MQRPHREQFEEPASKRRHLRIQEEPRTGEAAVGPTAATVEGRRIERRAGGGGLSLEKPSHDVGWKGREADHLAPRADRGQLPLERRAHKDDRRPVGRFLECLQEAVGRLVGEVVGVHDHGDLAGAEHRLEENPPAESFPHPVFVVADQEIQRDRRSVVGLTDDIDVGMAAGISLHARRTAAAGHEPRLRPFAGERFGQRQRKRPLADAGWTDEEIRPRDPSPGVCGNESFGDRVVPLDALPGHVPSYAFSRNREATARRIAAATSSIPAVASMMTTRSGWLVASAR